MVFDLVSVLVDEPVVLPSDGYAVSDCCCPCRYHRAAGVGAGRYIIVDILRAARRPRRPRSYMM
ncbi:MAG: hypothetical protein ACLR4Z_12030 [Butyricicoccaceae bacterium]